MRTILAIALLMTLFCGATAMAQSKPGEGLVPFNLPWDDASGGVTNVAGWLDAPAGGRGFVESRNGHFYSGGRRVRLLGVNLCFGGCFPEHTSAERIAARLARFGVNAVRFHHMDNRTAPGGIFKKDMLTLDPAQLDKLDYLVAQLKARGIWTNFNLHVSREYPGVAKWKGMPSYHKGVDHFSARAIELQRQYARDLLTHRNPYTKTRYVDEPAVAIVEINNENGLIHEWLAGNLDAMPEPLAGELSARWNRWLAARYADDAALRTAWGAGASRLGEEMLANGDFAAGLDGWFVEQHAGAKVQATVERMAGPQRQPVARLRVETPGQEGWHVQFNRSGLKLAAESAYTLSFLARADRERTASVYVGMAHAPWRQFWNARLDLSEHWQRFDLVVAVGPAEPKGRVVFSGLNQRGATFELADVSLRPGGVVGLAEGEKPGNIPFFRLATLGRRTPTARRDWHAFLWDTERDYWVSMRRFLKDMGVRCPIVGTIVGCSTPTMMAEMDAVDTHAYWQHPRFPGRPWDPGNWHVINRSMVADPPGTIGRLALRRVAGKPHLVTEYNHSSPNDYSAEAPLLLAAYGALQDWDGLFLFSYSHRTDDWDAGTFRNFFDIDRPPAKMANLLPAAAMFLRGDVSPARQLVARDLSAERERELLRTQGRPWELVHLGQLGVPDHTPLIHRTAIRVGPCEAQSDAEAPNPLPGPIYKADTGQVIWTAVKGREVVTVNSPRTRGLLGFTDGGEFSLSGVKIEPARSRLGWSTILLTVGEGEGFKAPARILLVATGEVTNTAMGWKDAAKTTVGRDWGRAPTLVEPVAAAITLPAAADDVTVRALDERGQPGEAVKVEDAGGAARFHIGRPHKTLWYEIVIQ